MFTRRRLWPLLASALVLAVGAPVLPERAGASPIDDKRAEASRVAAELDQLAQQASALDEDYNEARLALDLTQAELVTAKERIGRTDARFRAVRDLARARAIEAYVSGGGIAQVDALIGGDGHDLAVRNEYLKAAAGDDRRVLDDLAAVKDDLSKERTKLERQQQGALAARTAVEAKSRATEAAVERHQAVLRQVKGELAELVRAEEQRRAEEAARKAQAELAARQARERAARERARTQPPPATRGAPGPPAGVRAKAPPPSRNLEPGGEAPPPSQGAGAAVAEAKRQVGKPYRYGASGPDDFDCSGLTAWAWRAGGVSLPHSSRAQYSATTRVGLSQIQPGDLVFFGSPIHHVGIYVGGGQMIEASRTGYPVRHHTIYRSDMVGVGRP